MDAQVIYGGGEADSFEVVSGSPTEVGTGFDASYARCSVELNFGDKIRHRFVDSASAYLTVPSGNTVFVHGERTADSSAGTAGDLLEVCDSSDHPWVSLRKYTGSNVVGLFVNTGTGASPSWTLVGSGIAAFSNGVRNTDDVRVYIDPAGTAHQVEWIMDGTQIAVGTFSNSGFTDAASFTRNCLDFMNFRVSQPIATVGYSTVSAKVTTSVLDGAGASSAWTGAYTDANETPMSDVTYLQSTSAGDISTFTTGNVSLPGGYFIPTVFVWTRAKNSGSTPNNLQAVIRQSSTNYPSPSLSNLGLGFSNLPWRVDSQPAGGSWTSTAWNAAERGVKSVA